MLIAGIGWQVGTGANLCIVENSEEALLFFYRVGRLLPGWVYRVWVAA